MNAVSASNVSKIYMQGDVKVTALNKVSLEVAPGEFVALAGPSGSGKTTLLNLIGGLDEPDGGKISVNGKDFANMSSGDLAELRLSQIGFVFQSYNLIPVFTAEENVEYILQLQGEGKAERKKKARAMLDDVGLEGKYDRKPAQLSGGQQQRVAVARALVSNPTLILADEPTANLDSVTGESLLRTMREMNQKHGVTFIFSTHDSMVMNAAKRLVSMKDGAIVDDKVK
ncbi:putative ABC transport system ATP-binding protein [Desulfatibacillum alkenivorans DSM 16219]|jgi:putative ABC transport system ATP-binding protein|uniref:Putative ABC transport system ATP-binding protein n=1 Tax=Desulfatibacillum alkenivorans DSM 16219 TaxID=1121393 RepID=A0A1M6PC28_9BACT|nr:ABC transporter ATP-binding protein [Desulfatibacillum alkenivorans]SHK05422.1 putative ABC transport system ATP-binding protein [Desulfatibacillum alkenivorans DSM 16219]